MNLATLLRRAPAARPAAPRCGGCRFFDDDPHRFEAALPGVTIMSSGLASVRGDDGLCTLHDRHCGARGLCASFEAASQP